jgi:hypothetical protein
VSDDDIHFFAREAKKLKSFHWLEGDLLTSWNVIRKWIVNGRKTAKRWHQSRKGKKWMKKYHEKTITGKDY